MKEAFLQFVWQFQLFNKQDLKLVGGESLNIIKPGQLNHHSGPDFSQAHISYDELDIYGQIEIHLKSSDWYKHKHQEDQAYDSVILHVVLEDDQPAKDKEGRILPTLELKGRVPLNYYNNYESLIKNSEVVACGAQLGKVNQVILISMMDRVLIERLENKAQIALGLLDKQQGDWEEVALHMIVKSFGFKRNENGFEALADKLSFKLIQRHCNNIHDIEALLFGLSGFLHGERKGQDYFVDLKARFNMLNKKTGNNESIDPVIWKFFRLRPANFPTLRIAQLSSFLKEKTHLMSEILELQSKRDLADFFGNEVSDYWKEHYKFSKDKVNGISEIGESSIESLGINAVIPLWVAYGQSRNNEELIERSLKLLEQFSAENNKITRFWKTFDIPNNNAFDSQSLIQLYNNYCKERKCLECNIGVTLVREF